MGLLGEKNGAQGTVLNGVCKCRIGRNGILTEGSNDGVSARIVVQTVIRSLNHFIAAWNIPGISDIVTAVESDVTIVKHAVDDAQVNLAVSGHLDAGDFNLLLRVDILRCGTDQNSSTDSRVIIFCFLCLQNFIRFERICGQGLLGDLVCIALNIVSGNFHAESFMKYIQQSVVQCEVAAVHQRSISRTSGPLRMAHNSNILFVHKFQSAHEIHCIQASHRRAENIVFQNSLIVFIVDRCFAGSAAVSVDGEYNIASMRQFFGIATKHLIDIAGTGNNDHAGIRIFVGCSDRIVQFAL